MTWQLAVALTLVVVAAGYLSWCSWRAWKKATRGCSGGCGCGATGHPAQQGENAAVLISRDSLKLRSDGRSGAE